MAKEKYVFGQEKRLALVESARELTTKFFDFDKMYSTWHTCKEYDTMTYGEFLVQWAHPDGVTHYAVYYKKDMTEVIKETWNRDWEMTTTGKWRTLDMLLNWILRKQPTKKKTRNGKC